LLDAELPERLDERQGLDVATVPPTSTMRTSFPSAHLRMFSLMASVMCGMTCTVPPR